MDLCKERGRFLPKTIYKMSNFPLTYENRLATQAIIVNVWHFDTSGTTEMVKQKHWDFIEPINIIGKKNFDKL